MEIKRITASEVKRRLDRGEPIFFIDARNPTAWGESNIKLPGAVRIPLRELERHLDKIPRDRMIVTYCT